MRWFIFTNINGSPVLLDIDKAYRIDPAAKGATGAILYFYDGQTVGIQDPFSKVLNLMKAASIP
jgi:hypothetical protein